MNTASRQGVGFAVTYVRNTPKARRGATPPPDRGSLHRGQGAMEVFLARATTSASTLQPGDIVNVPIGIYRGFRNGSDDPEATVALVGSPDPGKVD